SEVCDDSNLIGHDGCSSTCTPEVPRWTPLRFGIAPLHQHAMAYDSARRRVVVFGGRSAGESGETYEFDGTTWHWLSPLVSPRSRTGAAMAYDAARSRIVMFGGSD